MAKRKAGANTPHPPRKRAGRPKTKIKDKTDDDGNKKDDGKASPARRMTRSMSVRDGAEELLLGLGCGVVDEGTSTTATLARQLDSAHITARQGEDSHSETLAPPIQTSPEPTLAGRIQGLAQELQDLILDFTLIAGVEGERVVIDSGYRPPWQLSVNSRTRKVVASAYYGGRTIFEAEKLERCYPAPPVRLFLRRWLLSLHAEDFTCIREIRLPQTDKTWEFIITLQQASRAYHNVRKRLELERLKLRPALLANNVLRLPQEIWAGDGPSTVWLNVEDCATRMARYREMLSRS